MRIKDLTSASAVEEALGEYDELGGQAFLGRHGFGPSTHYYLSRADLLYDAKAIAGVAYGYQHRAAGPLANTQFHGGEAAANAVLRAMGFTVLNSRTETVEEEREWRLAVWRNLLGRRDDSGLVTSDVLRSVGVHGNRRDVWTEDSRTRRIHPERLTIGLRRTEWPDPDVPGGDGTLHPYPSSRRPDLDRTEVDATKAAAALRLPLFAAVPRGDLHDVRLAWVEGWEDGSRLFLLGFGEAPPGQLLDHDRSEEQPFRLEGNRRRRRAGTVTSRPDQARFKLEVFQRYGPRCPLSGIAVPQMIEAAHLRGDADGGSSDARNGLPMNAALHRAFDAHLFAVNPDTLTAEAHPDGPSLESMGIVHPKLALEHPPHREALKWRYDEWLRRTGRAGDR
ncbi:MAG: HNH endonuclease [Kitasatospora sp.]|jgi:hypothetical protein|nr:HNH endonuclease [Kitasatospora sp.]